MATVTKCALVSCRTRGPHNKPYALRPTPYTLLYTVVADIAAIDIDWD
jgi:hypothetical protein